VYVTQSVLGGASPVQYLELSVYPDSVSVWGYCSKRLGNNVILTEQ